MPRLRDFNDPNKYRALEGLFSADNWREKRAHNLIGARNCRKALTNPISSLMPTYAKDDPVVKEAVGKWVARARRCHAMALGRKPVAENLVIIGRGGMYQGAMFASEARDGRAA